MPLCRLLHRRCIPIAARIQPLLRSFHNLNAFSTPEPNSSISSPYQPENSHFSSPSNPNPNQFTPDFLSSSSINFAPLSRSQGFLSAEEAAAERRRRKRRLRIEPPIQIGQRPPPPPRDPRQPDSTSALTGPRLNLHNRVQSLIRAFDLDAASKLARSAVHGRIRPTVFTCNAIIAAMHRAKRYEESKALFSYFFEQNTIVPNVVSYNYLINSLCDEGNVDEALSVYRRIIAEAPFGPSHVTYRHLTKGMVDAKRIEEAVELLREMLNKGHGADSMVYNNLIKGYLDLANIPRADDFFNELKERCLVYDGIVNATYMEFWFEQGKDKEAMESYKSLLDKKFRMVPATCNVLLSVLIKYGKKEQAWALFEHMLDDHTPPTFQAVNTETFNIMVNECFKEGKVEKAVETFRMSGKKERSKPFAMEVATYNNMIARFCEIDLPNEAEAYFNELCSKSLNPDVLSFRTLIDAFLRLEQVDDAVKYLTRMVDSGLRVVASYGVGVFEKLLARGKFDEVFRILSTMGEKDPKPDFPVYEVVVKGFCDAKELEKIEEILKQMMTYGVVVSSSLKEEVRNLFEKEGRGKEIDDVLDEKKWRNSQNYSQRQSSASFQSNRFQTVSNFPPRNDFSNQRLPWISNPQSSSQKLAPFSPSNGQNSSEKEIGEIVKQIGTQHQDLNQTNFQGTKNVSQRPREENQSNFNGGTPYQPSNLQSSWSYQGGNPVNYNGAYHQPSNPQSSWNFQGHEQSVNFPVEKNYVGTNPPNSWNSQRGDSSLNHIRSHSQPSNPRSSWDTEKPLGEANSWNYNGAHQQTASSWNSQGGDSSLNHIKTHNQPLNPRSSLHYNGANQQPSSSWNSQGGDCSLNHIKTHNQPLNPRSSLEYNGANQQPSNPPNSWNSHNQPSNPRSPWDYNGAHQQPFRESSALNYNATHHQPSNKQSSWVSQEQKTPSQWPVNENSTDYYQTKPMGSLHKPPNQQTSWSWDSPTTYKQFEEHHQSSRHQNLGSSNQQSSWSYEETRRPTDSHRSFWRDEDQRPRQSQQRGNQNMTPVQMGERWGPPASTSKSWKNMENGFQFREEHQSTTKAGDWFAEGVSKTLQGSGDS